MKPKNIASLCVIDFSYTKPFLNAFELHTQQTHKSAPEVFLGKGVLKICSKFKG